MATTDRSLKMLATALDMEERGKTFYEQAVITCKNELGREIFRTLIKDELIHMDRIRSIYSSLEANDRWNDNWKVKEVGHGDLKPFFLELADKYKGNIKADTGDIEALSVGIGFEEKAVKYYEEELKKSADPLEKAFIERMAGEEKWHRAVLIDTKQYLENPAAWYAENERAGFDGV